MADPVVLGRYQVLGMLGQGGMGTVFDAFDPVLHRRVAIKVLHEELGEHDARQLEREAQAMATLSHPNVVQVYEVGEFEGRTYVVMERVEGRTLTEWMRQEPRPDWRECTRVFMQLGMGLAAAHKRGLVHRDFKPSNAIIDAHGRARILDFGLACRSEEYDQTPAIVEKRRAGSHPAVDPAVDPALDPALDLGPPPPPSSGKLKGTPAYMAPELFGGRRTGAGSDQYSFCMSLYEALYGKFPAPEFLQGSGTSGLRKRRTQARPEVPVPRYLRRLLRRGMAKDPADRFPSMEALLIALEDFQSRLDVFNTRMLCLQSVLGILLFSMFWLLDWLMLREHVWTTLGIRLGVCLMAGCVYGLSRARPELAERHVDTVVFMANLVAGWAVCGIVWVDGGLESYHSSGLNLLVLCVGVMFLWSLRRALVFSGVLYLSYVSPAIFVGYHIESVDAVMANQLFFVSTILIMVVAQRQRYRLKEEQFWTDKERRLLQAEIDAIGRIRKRRDSGGHPVSSTGVVHR
ncbi:MAG: serine/threonine-protein kinase [Myxococcota bacterium]